MTAASRSVAALRASADWNESAAAWPMRLGDSDVVCRASFVDGPVRVSFAATGLPYVAKLTQEERGSVRDRLRAVLGAGT